MNTSFSLKGGLGIVVLVAAFIGATDPWAEFHPELVKKISCRCELADVSPYGVGHPEDHWIATAEAERTPKDGNWEMTIGIFPPTVKGRHEAEKACSKWMDAAGKRMKEGR